MRSLFLAVAAATVISTMSLVAWKAEAAMPSAAALTTQASVKSADAVDSAAVVCRRVCTRGVCRRVCR